jgi:hypothetical protein
LRRKRVLTAGGQVEVSRPYYLCPHGRTGQFSADAKLDGANTEFSPGVRSMQALVAHESPFDHGRQQMQLLAGLEVTTKSVERTAEVRRAVRAFVSRPMKTKSANKCTCNPEHSP